VEAALLFFCYHSCLEKFLRFHSQVFEHNASSAGEGPSPSGGKGTNKREKYKRKSELFLFIPERKYLRQSKKVTRIFGTDKRKVGNLLLARDFPSSVCNS